MRLDKMKDDTPVLYINYIFIYVSNCINLLQMHFPFLSFPNLLQEKQEQKLYILTYLKICAIYSNVKTQLEMVKY